MYGSYSSLLNKLKITIIAINGKIDERTFTDTLSHEIGHKYQIEKRGKNYFDNDSDLTKYTLSAYSKSSSNGMERCISDILYISYKFEQDSNIHGAYSYMMQKIKDGSNIANVYKETEAFIALFKLRNAMKHLLSLSDKEKEIYNQYIKLTYNLNGVDKVIEIGEQTQNRFEKKLARMYAKVVQDNKLTEWKRY